MYKSNFEMYKSNFEMYKCNSNIGSSTVLTESYMTNACKQVLMMEK